MTARVVRLNGLLSTAADQNFSAIAGDGLTLQIVIKDDAGAPVNCDGASARWWMGVPAGWSSAVPLVAPLLPAHVKLKKDTASGGIVIFTETQGNQTFWVLNVTLNPADTVGFPPWAFRHEAEIVFLDGAVATVVVGGFTLSAELIPSPVDLVTPLAFYSLDFSKPANSFLL